MVTSFDEERQAFALVRSYSYEIEQRIPDTTPRTHVLAQALAGEQAELDLLAEPWRALFGSTEIYTTTNDLIKDIMADNAQQLKNVWRDYHNRSKRDDRLDLDSIDPTAEGISSLIRNALASRSDQDRRGGWAKVKDRFHRVCGTLDSHKSLLNTIPQSSEYVSIFAGSITAIIQASVTHEGIAEDISEALCKIDEQIADVHVDLELFSTDEMRRRVADMYSAIFNYLAKVSTWLTQKKLKRLTSSFNDKLREEYQGALDDVKAKSDRIKSYATQGTQKAIKVGFETSWNDRRAADARVAARLDRIERHNADHAQAVLQLGRNLTLLLKSQSSRYLDEHQARDVRRIMSRSTSPSIFSIEDVTESDAELQALIDVSQSLQAFYERDRFRLEPVGAEASILPPDEVMSLSNWLKTPSSTSSFLWLRADEAILSQDRENPLSMIAAKLIDATKRASLVGGLKPYLVSYFCHTRRGEMLREGNLNKQAQGAVALSYAILTQLLDIIRQMSGLDAELRIGNALGLRPEDILALDGSMQTWEQAMELLKAVAPLVPSGTLCVVDALHCLDHRQTESQLRQLVCILRSSTMKVLFTTSGRCAALAKEMTRGEIKSVDHELF